MDSRIEIVADATSDGTPVMSRLRGGGHYALRATGPGEVHLVGTAAGPLGGDTIRISVLVQAGARLTLRGVAATIALPGRDPDTVAHCTLDLQVEDGGRLDCALPPTVVCHGAVLRTETRLRLADTATVLLGERVVLGRHGEPGGSWVGRLVADRAGVPVLRSTQRSVLLTCRPVPPGTPPVRALVTELWREGRPGAAGAAAPATHGGAVRCPLPDGSVLTTATAHDLTTARTHMAHLTSRTR